MIEPWPKVSKWFIPCAPQMSHFGRAGPRNISVQPSAVEDAFSSLSPGATQTVQSTGPFLGVSGELQAGDDVPP